MNTLEQFERLARTARIEPVPPLDVADRVLATLRRPAATPSEMLPLCLMAGLSVLAASIMVAVAADAWLPLLDPVAGLFQAITPVLL